MSDNTAIQLRITTDMDALPAAIEFNYDELKAALQTYLGKFDGIVVTEDQIRQATVDRAEINRVAKTIARARIDTKKRVLEPFELFEARAKELEGLCHDVEGKISAQLEEFEKERVAQKLQALENLWLEIRREFFLEEECNSPHFRAFFAEQTNPKTKGCWLNKGLSWDAVHSAMRGECQRCRDLLVTVRDMYAETDEETRAKAYFAALETFNLQRTVQAVNAFRAERQQLAAARKAKEERERAAEEARKLAEERAKAEAEARAKAQAEAQAQAASQPPPPPPGVEIAPAPKPAPVEVADPASAVKKYSVVRRLTGTKEQFERLREAMDVLGIICEKV